MQSNEIQCTICEQGCIIPENGVGICGMYTTNGTTVIERFPCSYLITTPISIETMPLIHFHPKGKFLQVSTIGCNFSCPGCISEILAKRVDELAPALEHLSAEMVIARAQEEGCIGLLFCLNEPAVSFYTVLDLAKAAHAAGLLFGSATNGYFTASAVRELIPYLDCVSVGLKGCSKESYAMCGASDPDVPLRMVRMVHDAGVHVETAIIHANGSEGEILQTCRKIADISPEIPVQVMRFIAFGMSDVKLEPTIRESEVLCDQIRAINSSVYLFNSPGSTYCDTRCPVCSAPLIKREMHGPMGARIIDMVKEGVCTCGYQVPFYNQIAGEEFEERGMTGGYRPTRALEIIESILVCLGVHDKQTHAKVWFEMMREKYIDELHFKIQDPDGYFEMIRYLAGLTARTEEGEVLCRYIQNRIEQVKACVSQASHRPLVYYMMGTPLFSLNKGRFEVKLVNLAGGTPANRDYGRVGMPGIMIAPDDLNQLNPDVLVVSGLFSTPEDDVYEFCTNHSISVSATRNRRVIVMPVSWDFGNPRWVLGLMYLANNLHPEFCHFDMDKECEAFHDRFFGIVPGQIRANRSFYRPSILE